MRWNVLLTTVLETVKHLRLMFEELSQSFSDSDTTLHLSIQLHELDDVKLLAASPELFLGDLFDLNTWRESTESASKAWSDVPFVRNRGRAKPYFRLDVVKYMPLCSRIVEESYPDNEQRVRRDGTKYWTQDSKEYLEWQLAPAKEGEYALFGDVVVDQTDQEIRVCEG